MLKVPFVIYADFETFVKPIDTCENDPLKSSTTARALLDVCSFGYKIVSSDSSLRFPTVVYRGDNVIETFIDRLIEEEIKIQNLLRQIEPMEVNEDIEKAFETATNCHICKKQFDKNSVRVRNHDHLSGKFFGIAHKNCNLNFKQAKFIPVIFHNLKGFDAHLIMQKIGKYKSRKIEIIPLNNERYVSFSFGRLRFIDSFQFLSTSLKELVNNLEHLGMAHFKHFTEEFNTKTDFKLLLKKQFYPYEFMTDKSKFNIESLPPKSAFYDTLSKSEIGDSDYEHALNVWKLMKIKNMGEYHDLYLKLDIVLLADAFEKFREITLNNFELDPAHFYTAAGLSWSACLKMTGVKLELLTDLDQFHMIENACRGGVSMTSNRYAKCNNPYYKEEYDPNKPHKYLMYYDMNNQYGFAMAQYLPVGDFQWMKKEDIENLDILHVSEDNEYGYILEVDLLYPDSLHDIHSDFSLAPESKQLNFNILSSYSKRVFKTLHNIDNLSSETLIPYGEPVKLIPNLLDKEKYVLHYRNLQFYIKQGLMLDKIHRVLKFKQSQWLKTYVDFNTKKRQEATDPFTISLHKLYNNVVFGKTMEKVRHRRNIKLVHNQKMLKKLVSKPSFDGIVIFNKDLVAVTNKWLKIKLNKPIYTGFTVLDLSKLFMYDFHYNYIKTIYGDRAKLLMTDTDSLFYCIETNDVYKDMYQNRHLFDTSNYPKDSPLYSTENKRVMGKMRDETNGKPVIECVCLRAKMYSFITQSLDGARCEVKRAKGVVKSVVKKELTHELYKNTLLNNSAEHHCMNTIRSDKHQIYLKTINKISLSSFDDKRYILENGINTLAFGPYKIKDDL